MRAASRGKVDCLKILVQAGADLEAKNKVRVEFDGHVYSVGIEGWRRRGNGVQGWGEGREGGWGKCRVGGWGGEGWSTSFKFYYFNQINHFNSFQIHK